MNGELEEERLAAAKALSDLSKHLRLPIEPVLFEHQECPPSTTPRAASLQWVRDSDLFIGIYFKTLSPIVEDEFEAASERNLPIFSFVKRLDAGSLSVPEQLEYKRLQRFLLREVIAPAPEIAQESYVYKFFRTPADLWREVVCSVLRYYPHRFTMHSLPRRYVILNTEVGDTDRSAELFVPPRCYEEAFRRLEEERLLIILGPAHTGKTSLAHALARALKSSRRARRVIAYPKSGEHADVEGLLHSVIIFDDIFGGAHLNRELLDRGDDYKWLLSLKQRNYVILTSRTEVFQEARNLTKLGEARILDSLILPLEPHHYHEEDLAIILQKHLEYFEVESQLRKEVLRRRAEIVEALNFPHSYRIFVNHGLNEILQSGRSWRDVLEEAKEIEEVVRRWFGSFYPVHLELFYFLFTLALAPGSLRKTFERVHRVVVEAVREARECMFLSAAATTSNAWSERRSHTWSWIWSWISLIRATSPQWRRRSNPASRLISLRSSTPRIG